MPFNAIMEERSVPRSLRADYRKWLMYYLDFRVKYPPPDARSEQVRLFIEKLRAKNQSQDKLEQAAAALSLFFSMQPRKQQTVQSLAVALKRNVPKPRALRQAGSATEPVIGAGRGRPAGGKRYNEWRCLERTKSPEWDAVIGRLEAEITTRHYSRKTLKTYADWIRKYQSFLKNKPPLDVSAEDVKAYLTYLAVKCKVSASTQNQAFNALLFLFRHILKKDFGDHKDTPRAKKSNYIPIVLSRQEIDAVLKFMSHPYSLLVKLLYGCGLRLFEGIKLRVQDSNFDEGVLTLQR
jgi:hypothetical protein